MSSYNLLRKLTDQCVRSPVTVSMLVSEEWSFSFLSILVNVLFQDLVIRVVLFH